MTSERSAGVVVYISTLHGREYLLLDYGRYWDFPKGHLEKGEDDRTAALRELQEETGITDVVLDASFFHEIQYTFRSRKGPLVDKTVAFFMGQTQTRKVKISDEHVAYAFVPYEDAVKQVTYANARNLLKKAESRLDDAAKSDRMA
ncbi:MAG TPA: NUDIX domain-containing protein [Tepidisphaeraceae bacterium]|jgi:8-oxo-dGTP pyrophosphatase MutT (NUDIX family)|nr:NUDIX domain-containing protein [Tepidisphaeraceae bacterium]